MGKATFIVRIDEDAVRKEGRYELRINSDIQEKELAEVIRSVVGSVLAWNKEEKTA